MSMATIHLWLRAAKLTTDEDLPFTLLCDMCLLSDSHIAPLIRLLKYKSGWVRFTASIFHLGHRRHFMQAMLARLCSIDR